MNSTELLLKLIRKKYKSIRQFAIAADIPYSTVKGGLRSGIQGMAVETVIKMCEALQIRVEDLLASGKDRADRGGPLSADEYYLLEKYRSASAQSKQEIMHYIEYRHDIDTKTRVGYRF